MLIGALGKKRGQARKTFPMSFFCSRFGTEIILDELGRIEHGVFS